MKTTVSFYDFVNAFDELRPGNFTREGLEALWDYLEEYEDSCGEEVELDVIGLCCDFSEDGYEAIADYYGIELDHNDDKESHFETVRDWLENEGALVGEVEGGFVYRNI